MTAATGYTWDTGGKPTDREIAFWNERFRLFEYQPPDPRASSEARRRGWGFSPDLKPPVDCYDFVVANLKREQGANLNARFRPNVKYSVLLTLATYFAWLRTEKGTRWLLDLYGIKILAPHHGYAYCYQGTRLVEPHFGLRIYHVDHSARTGMAPHEYCGAGLTDELVELAKRRRGPSSEPVDLPGQGMWEWVGSFVRNWLMEKNVDRNWPTYKRERVSGYDWAKNVLRRGSQTDYVWTILGKAEVFRDERIYRIQMPAYEERVVSGVAKRFPPDKPGVVWTDRRDMRIVPLDEVDGHEGVPPQTVALKFRCQSCDQVRCCTTLRNGRDNRRLCMSCRGMQEESGHRPSLQLCRYRECRRCPEHLRSDEDLINRISQLNSRSEYVRRS